MQILFILLAGITGLFVGSYLAMAIERLPYEDDFHSQLFDGDGKEQSLQWWMRIPFVFFFVHSPFDHPLRWYDKIPLLPFFIYAWRYSNFKKLMARPHCRSCRTPIALKHRIPVLSYLYLGARCPSCRIKIPGRVLVVEALTGILFTLLASHFGPSWLFLMSIFMISLFIVASVIDWRYQIIPDELNVMGFLVGVAFAVLTPLMLRLGILSDAWVTARIPSYNMIYSYFSPEQAALGVLAGAGPLYLFAEIGGMFAGTDAMGGGDIKLAAWVGAFLGWRGALVSLFYSALIAAPCGILLIVLGKGRKEGGFTKFAFGPYICMGAGLVLYHGSDQMIASYMEFNERLVYFLMNVANVV